MNEQSIRIALAGNPNCGKTTLFNALTGSNQFVGNWPGVTVEKKEGYLKKRNDVIVTDLPGIYSLSPYTLEEVVARNYLVGERPDAILNIVDGTNLERNLYLTTQLCELGIPVVVALNKTDANEQNHTSIDTALLSKKLGCAVVQTSSSKARGVRELVSAALDSVGKTQTSPFVCPKFSHDDAESVRSCDKLRFEYVKSIVSDVELRTTDGSSTRAFDKLDSLLTSKWLGIPVFAAVMFAVFWISQSGPTVYFADLLTSLLENGKIELDYIKARCWHD